MICLYLLLALFSCDLAQSRGVPLWYKEIESLLANHLSSNDAKLSVATREGVEYTGTLSEIEHFLKYDSSKGQDIVFNHNFDLKDSMMESVIGTDTRQLQNPNIYPFTAMGRIEIGCTGTFISPHVVLTAAHCVYSNGQYYGNLDFYRGKDCDAVYDSIHEFSFVYVYNDWKTSEGSNYDIAWIVYKVPSPVHMPYTSDTPSVGTEISIYGYPGDKEHECLWGSSGALINKSDHRLQYQVDTAGGMSGSAIYYNDGGNPVIIGVHTNGGFSFNSGTRMTNGYKGGADAMIALANYLCSFDNDICS